MIAYVTLGSNDLEKSGRFYDAVLGPLGATRDVTMDGLIVWSTDKGPSLSLMSPYDGNSATNGNGTMVAFQADSTSKVDEIHAVALANGGRDEGAPGQRGRTGYYGYVRDPDGNKITFFHPSPTGELI